MEAPGQQLPRRARGRGPGYRFYAIKQKSGVLAYQAQPGPAGARARHLVDEITERYAAESAVTCESCAKPGKLRELEPEWLTLCDQCSSDLVASPYPERRARDRG